MVFHFLKKADCVVAMGSSLTRTPWGAADVPTGKKIVHCTNDPNDINKEFPTEAAMLGDAKLVLEALIAEIGNKKRADDGVAEVQRGAARNGCKNGSRSSPRPRCRSTSTA